MQTAYRASEDPPVTKVEMMNEYWASESVPSETFCHPIECDPKENPFNIQYIRSRDVPVGDSRLMYDLGVTFVATSGQQGTNTIGDLWVTYEVELKKPVVTSNVLSIGNSVTTNFVATGSTSGATWFDGAATSQGSLTLTNDGVRTLYFPEGIIGYYNINIRFSAATTFTAFNSSGAPTLTNCTEIFISGAVNRWQTILGGTTPTLTNGFYAYKLAITDPASVASITFPSISWTGSIASITVVVNQFYY